MEDKIIEMLTILHNDIKYLKNDIKGLENKINIIGDKIDAIDESIINIKNDNQSQHITLINGWMMNIKLLQNIQEELAENY